jgi:hypothetical protein
MSKLLYRPIAAPLRMGMPLITMLTQAASKGKIPSSTLKKLKTRNIPEKTVKKIVLYSLSFFNLVKLINFITPPLF